MAPDLPAGIKPTDPVSKDISRTPPSKQGPQFSCFLCHNTGGSNSGKTQYPGKNINISHVILGSIPPTSPTPTATPAVSTKK